MTKTLEKPIKANEPTSKDLVSQEIEYPETMFVRDIENRVFQSIVLQCIARIKGISLLDKKFFNHILGRDGLEAVKGVHAEQDSKSNAVNVKVEVKICYGISIPEKAEEIQTKVTEEITKLTGLHVACVHVVFKNVIMEDAEKAPLTPLSETPRLLTECASPQGMDESE